MIDVVNVMKVAPGKTAQALEWAKKLLAYDKKAGRAAAATSLLRPLTGEMDTIVFVGRYPSMAAFEEMHNRRTADSGWMAILNDRSDWHLGSTRRIYGVVE